MDLNNTKNLQYAFLNIFMLVTILSTNQFKASYKPVKPVDMNTIFFTNKF